MLRRGIPRGVATGRAPSELQGAVLLAVGFSKEHQSISLLQQQQGWFRPIAPCQQSAANKLIATTRSETVFNYDNRIALRDQSADQFEYTKSPHPAFRINLQSLTTCILSIHTPPTNSLPGHEPQSTIPTLIMTAMTPLTSLLTFAIACTLVLVTTAVPLPPSSNGPTFATQASPNHPQPEIPTTSAPLDLTSDPGRLQHYKQMGLEPTQVPKSQPYDNVHPDAKAFPGVPPAAHNAMMVGAKGLTRGAAAMEMTGSAAGVHMMGSSGGFGNGGQDIGAVGGGTVAESGMGAVSGGERAMAVSHGATMGAAGVEGTAMGEAGVGTRADVMAVGGAGMNEPMGTMGAVSA